MMEASVRTRRPAHGLALRLLTRPCRARFLARRPALAAALAPAFQAGWSVRFAGPKADILWGRDGALQRARRLLILPPPWLLSEDQLVAVALQRLARAGFAASVPDALLPALRAAELQLQSGFGRLD
ncbi:hypothetical protein [Fuscovulum blasticum]|uniref:hypothetical protein n=1 Tax=Fuscovulum blasticum TaxID=1075 RepID=UPI000D3E9FD1|nr:hypothetical protein [Fuscovulum blasticum]AWD22546.1 hypothetical protein B6K69_13405 [Fuscovulum blasticum]